MFGLLLLVIVACHCTAQVNGQCTVPHSKVESASDSDGKILRTVEELDLRLQGIEAKLSSAIERINENLNTVLDHVNESLELLKFQDYCRDTSAVCDCSDIKANGYIESGVYRIYAVHENKRYFANAYCDMTTADGGWTVFQRRKDGSVDFERLWNDYAKGFGNRNGEHWLGNNFIHLLTSKRSYRLRIDLEDFDGQKRYAEYSTFNISSSEDKYRLSIGNYSGDANDSLSRQNGRQFTTRDSDNDASSSVNCAVDRRGAWWYEYCSDSNLNGLYKRGNYSDCLYCGIDWRFWRGYNYSLKKTELKISPVA